MIKPTAIKFALALVIFTLVGFVLGTKQDVFQSLLTTPIALRPTTVASGLSVKAKDLTQMLKNKNFTLINVHTPYEGEIEKTDAFIAYNDLAANSSLLPFDKTTPIILYCKTGRMSGEALSALQKLGYTNVKHLDGGMEAWQKQGGKVFDLSKLDQQVIPEAGVEMPVSWGDIGPKLTSLGVIDDAKFRQVVKLTPDQEEIYAKGTDKKIKIDRGNVQFVVDMLWALGL
ncbi:rhodanese-like domain-containing protein, partial [Candidatus Microgenomates bacterium]|nr:rhodanese-like domain-containing protein [Candidatus Microgenomates bacterium]